MFEVKMPRFDVNDNKVTVVEILVKDKAYVREGQLILKAESTKMLKEIYAEKAGYIRIIPKSFDSVEVGAIVAYISDKIEELEDINNTQNTESSIVVNASAKAVDLAKKLGIDINAIKKDGIIKTADVEAYANNMTKNATAPVIENKNAAPVSIDIYSRERVMIIGAGRLSEQVIDILLDDKDKVVVGIVDSYKTEYSAYCIPVYTCDVFEFPEKVDPSLYDSVIISLGGDKKSMKLREKLYELYKSKGIRFTNAIGDNVNIRRAVSLGENNIIMHNVYVGTGASIGNNNIISYGTCIGHHCMVGSHNLFAPAFVAPGSICIGNSNIFMTGVKTVNYITIGNNVILPVGYNVIGDIADDTNLLQ